MEEKHKQKQNNRNTTPSNIISTGKVNPSSPQKIFIGVSWPYANGNLTIGHLVGQYVTCDIFARYHRLKGNTVLMVSGSDSHGAPVIFAAEEQGRQPAELAAASHEIIKETYRKLGFLYENYTTTHTDNHTAVAQNIFLVLGKLGFLSTKKTKQYYDPKVKRFLPDRYVRGTCPKCGATNARGDECPECGEMLDPEDLTDPRSTLSDATPVIKETEHYYLDLQKAEPALKEWLKDKSYWRKWVREFTNGWLRSGLKPRSVTRDFTFGVPVPVKGWEKKVLYVWIEAVVGYLSAAIEWAENLGKPSAWESFWKDPACKHYYFIAGGNVPFHTIIWPAEIIGYNGKYADDELWEQFKLPGESLRKPLNLPYDVPANNILTFRGKKMSKGDKVGISLDTLMERYNPDIIRYFCVRFAPEQTDREFTWKDFIDANNNELVANIGNFVNRVLSFTQTRFGGLVPKGKLDKEVNAQITSAFSAISEYIEQADFVRATESLLQLGHFANKYFNDEKPWTMKTTAYWSDAGEHPKWDQVTLKSANTLYNSIQLVNAIRILLKPFLPFTAEQLAEYLNVKEPLDPNKQLEQTGKVTGHSDIWQFHEIPAGLALNPPNILFQKLDYSEDLEKADRNEPESVVTAEALPASFASLDPSVVVGKILTISTHPSDDALQIAIVDAGKQAPLSIVCGAPNIKSGDVVPVALPGAKINTPDGKISTIKTAHIRGARSDAMLCSPLELGARAEHDRILILPDSLSAYLGKALRSIRSVEFRKSPELYPLPTAWTLLTSISITRNRSRKLTRWIKDTAQTILASKKDLSWRNDPIYQDTRRLHEQFGAADTPGSAEDMVAFILDKGEQPNINSLVDLYNGFSALTGISIGAHDIDKIQGTPRLVILDNDMPFRHATSNEEDIARKGEYAYVDDAGILCRLDIKQGNRTTVTKDTKNVLVLFQGNAALGQEVLDQKIVDFKQLVASLL